MAELKQMDTHLEPLNYFQYPCGHKFFQTLECPICANERQIKLIVEQGVAYGAQIEKRNQVLRECKELFNLLQDVWGCKTIKIDEIKSKIEEVLK